MTGKVGTKVTKPECRDKRFVARPEVLIEKGEVNMTSEKSTRLLWRELYKLILAAWLALCLVNPGFALSSEASMGQESRTLKGPDAVQNRIASDRVAKDTPFEWEAMKPYYDWRTKSIKNMVIPSASPTFRPLPKPVTACRKRTTTPPARCCVYPVSGNFSVVAPIQPAHCPTWWNTAIVTPIPRFPLSTWGISATWEYQMFHSRTTDGI